jgi:hypothetical protein
LEEVDGVGAVVFVAGIVDDADVILPVQFDVLSGEFLRCQRPSPVKLAILVLPLPIELLGRGAQMDTEDSPDVGEAFVLARAGFSEASAGVDYGAQFARRGSQDVFENRVHPARV